LNWPNRSIVRIEIGHQVIYGCELYALSFASLAHGRDGGFVRDQWLERQAESFNGRLREECLNANWFLSLRDAKEKIEAWRRY
jgi:hypothetical protein